MNLSIFNFLKKDNLENNKIRIEILAIILGGLFALWKWGAEVYWERQPSYGVYFHNLQTNKEEPALYLRELGATFSNSAYCNIEGIVGISNTSVAPMHIENTTLHFIPFELNQCKSNKENIGDCLVTNTASAIYDRLCKSQISTCPPHNELTIRPVDDQPLFGKRSASRPFNLAVPKPEAKKGLLIVAEQQIGRGCISKESDHRGYFDWLRSCEKSRAFIADTNLCQGV